MAKAPREQFDVSLKILTIGDSGVGKTCLLLRYVDDRFSSSFISTIGIDFKVKTLNVDGKRIRCQLWDTAGQERFRTITTSYFRGAHGIALCFDLTDTKSFASVQSWIQQIKDNADDSVVLILVANKVDAEDKRQVSKEDAQALAKKHGVPLYFTSAKHDIGVKEAFEGLTRTCLQNELAKAPKAKATDTVKAGEGGSTGQAAKCGC